MIYSYMRHVKVALISDSDYTMSLKCVSDSGFETMVKPVPSISLSAFEADEFCRRVIVRYASKTRRPKG